MIYTMQVLTTEEYVQEYERAKKESQIIQEHFAPYIDIKVVYELDGNDEIADATFYRRTNE